MFLGTVKFILFNAISVNLARQSSTQTKAVG
jgi:hypothetical protein